MNKEKIIQAGKIAKQVKDYAKSIIKKDVLLLEIAEKIEGKILELGGEIAFPVNLSINEVAAHFTPLHNDETRAHGLLKIDIGVHVDGWIADTAFSVDLENSEENKKLIKSTEKALEQAIKIAKEKTTGEIGQVISDTIESFSCSPIVNLGGHGLGENEFHTEPFIPNIDNQSRIKLKKGLYAIEPFATTNNASGKVHDGQSHGIYQLINNERNIRNPIAREVLKFIEENHPDFPFASRWIVKELGTKALIGLRQLEQNENIHHYPQLIESSKNPVAQSENTILIDDKNIITTTN